ncbi:MAG: hypothetical protein ABIU63_03350 [Chitinophagaceae bacterium]
MKKFLLVLAIGVAVVSCNNATDSTVTTPVENTDSIARAAAADSMARVATVDSLAKAATADSLAKVAAADSLKAKHK